MPDAALAPGSAERTAFQQDYDRIVFTSAFRRMKDKTQVFPLSKSDYVRTRLTHSLEASCVGRSLGALVGREIIARHELKNVESGDFGAIVAAACLAHDIGNPPFGHAGEDAIREWFRNSGLLERHPFTPAQRADFEHYEGNAQGFRIVTRLQNPANPGLQLTSAVLAAFTKYPRPSSVATELDGKSGKKFGFFQQDIDNFRQVARSTGLVERIPGTAWRRHPLAFLVEVADDTCYLIVDLEDAARLGFVPYKDAECLLGDLAAHLDAATPAQAEQRLGLETLQPHLHVALVACAHELHVAQQQRRHVVARCEERGGVLELGVDDDPAPAALAFLAGQLQHFEEARDAQSAVVRLAATRERLHRTQPRELAPAEIVDPPFRLAFRARNGACRELGARRHVGAARQAAIVARDEHAVARHDEVGLDHVGALRDRERVTFQRVFRQVAARAAMRDHQRLRAIERVPGHPAILRGENRDWRTGRRPAPATRGRTVSTTFALTLT